MSRFRLIYFLYFAISLFIGLMGCSRNEVFSEFHSFPQSEWSKADRVVFEVNMSDTIGNYNLRLDIRNNNNYPFQNLWLFIDAQSPGGTITRDTLNVELADVYGKWYGTGLSLYSYAIDYKLNVNYPDTGVYRYFIQQAMRQDVLPGVSDIGLTILKNTHE